MNEYRAIADALAAQAKRDLAVKRAEDRARAMGERRLDVDMYDKREHDRPAVAYDFKMGKSHYKGRGAFWCVVMVQWNGSEWKRVRRLTGRLPDISAAFDKLAVECRRLKLRRVQS